MQISLEFGLISLWEFGGLTAKLCLTGFRTVCWYITMRHALLCSHFLSLIIKKNMLFITFIYHLFHLRGEPNHLLFTMYL